MDPTRPASVDPRNIIEAVNDWNVTQAFGSPALWNVVGRYCEEHKIVLPTLKRVLSAGAPVPPHVLQRMKAAIPPDGDVHTPYGATEALPVASISASEVLAETAAKSAAGAGTCVGRQFPGIEWKVIRITDEPIATIDRGRRAAARRDRRADRPRPRRHHANTSRAPTANAAAQDPRRRHVLASHGRRGLSGHIRPLIGRSTRFWFCGRKSHRVITPQRHAVHDSLRSDLQPASAGLSLRPRRRRAARPAAAGRLRRAWPEHRPQSRAESEQLHRPNCAQLASAARAHGRDRRLLPHATRCPSISATTPRSFAKSWRRLRETRACELNCRASPAIAHRAAKLAVRHLCLLACQRLTPALAHESHRRHSRQAQQRPPRRHPAAQGRPTSPDGKGVLVRVLKVGVDATDREINDALYGNAPPGDKLPGLGHESFGIVEEVGPNVTPRQAGRLRHRHRPPPRRVDLRPDRHQRHDQRGDVLRAGHQPAARLSSPSTSSMTRSTSSACPRGSSTCTC